ncbi:MAG: histone H1 [Chloracidobacterium sp.]|nr:histone H1 [Chloracidobacterium sp.]
MLEQMPTRPRDANQLAKMIVDLTTGDATEPEMSPRAKAGQLGGLKGGKARAAKLSSDERSAIAKKAADARWQK